MKAYVIDQAQKRIVLTDRQSPVPGPGEILVDVKAVSINYHDLLKLSPDRNRTLNNNTVACSDGAGVVVSTGEGVTNFKVGDRVCGAFYKDWESGNITNAPKLLVRGGDIDGMLAEQVAINETGAAQIPGYMSFEEASTLPCAALTAWSGVVDYGRVKKGDKLLTLGTGGVSLFALQFAKAQRAEVIITSSSDAKLEKAKVLGADHLINYRTEPEWEKEVLKITAGQGVDIVVDTGGPGNFRRSLESVKMGGSISIIGTLDMNSSNVNPFKILFKNLHLHGVRVGSCQALKEMIQFFIIHEIKPVIEKVFSFDEAWNAYEYIMSASHFGKVVISLDT